MSHKLWHAKMIFNSQNIMQLSKYRATFKIGYNFWKYIITAQEGCIFFGNMYNDLRAVMGVVPCHALVFGKDAGKGETYLFYPQYNIT